MPASKTGPSLAERVRKLEIAAAWREPVPRIQIMEERDHYQSQLLELASRIVVAASATLPADSWDIDKRAEASVRLAAKTLEAVNITTEDRCARMAASKFKMVSSLEGLARSRKAKP